MRIFLVVHGFVQGVGYRHFVRVKAEKYGIKGMVRNADDGSVQIFAEADERSLENFEKEINVSMGNGPSVMNIEKHKENEASFPKSDFKYDKFVIEK